ncbi:DNA mismatch repair protein MutS [Desulfosporosinus sp. OT]|uniref:DNA mismatch repair protein MutS n=1 Tax=Desulfosporosinus sp. OT TaxID=913865 RepID=UPI0002239B1E|nr:DNA mismatch repair protein MutS [Desulfosporosinus sp. OT]EGW40267.1 DNA mismatch repair protein MutS [Desulfosporosinus sp. OT]
MTTPMMRQYQGIKAKAPDAILFYRLGDFYEMFGEDAELAAPILQIALTGRDAGEGKKIAMCGVPYHALDNYLAKLVKAGHKVAICEQVEDAKNAKGIVKRGIIRIVSPGTLTESVSERSNHYLASVYHDEHWGLAFLDLSTGEFSIFQTSDFEVLLAELSRINPAELLLPPELMKRPKPWVGYYCSVRERKTFGGQELQNRFSGQQDLFLEFPVATQAATALWTYLLETMPGVDPTHIIEIKTFRSEQWMFLDQWTRHNLELTESLRSVGKRGTLLSVLDLTQTAFGGRLLKHWIDKPLLSQDEIERRLNAIEELTSDSFLRKDLFKLLSEVYDLERLMGKVSYGTANAKDLLSLAQTLALLPEIRTLITASSAETLKIHAPHLEGLDSFVSKLQSALNPTPPLSLRDGNIIKTGYSQEVDELRYIASGGKEWVAQLENAERERTGIRSLKIGYNKVFGYFIEITHANAHLIPTDYQRKQTLSNAERFITPELKEYEQKIIGAEEKLKDLEYELLLALREDVRTHTKAILQVAQVLAEVDVFVSLAEVAVRNHYVRPQIKHNGEIVIIEGRHPVVEQMLEPGVFVPNDTQMSESHHLALITGPNMAGKSTYMRQVALIVLMAHIGSFVPAKKASIAQVDRIFTRVGASDDLAAGQSTFMVEMQEVAHILRYATSKSLIILDEIGRGTATFDGLSIAWAVAEHLIQSQGFNPKTLFATHYHELTQLQDEFPRLFNLHVGVKERGEDIVFLHKILPGKADRSYGIQVARLAGLPPELLQRAKTLLIELESSEPVHAVADPSTVVTQFSLFDVPQTHPLLQEINQLPLEDMTARQALQYLFDLRERIQSTETM